MINILETNSIFIDCISCKRSKYKDVNLKVYNIELGRDPQQLVCISLCEDCLGKLRTRINEAIYGD